MNIGGLTYTVGEKQANSRPEIVEELVVYVVQLRIIGV